MTCRCPICGRNEADTNRKRKSYINVGLGYSENGPLLPKKMGRKIRRKREKRNLLNED